MRPLLTRSNRTTSNTRLLILFRQTQITHICYLRTHLDNSLSFTRTLINYLSFPRSYAHHRYFDLMTCQISFQPVTCHQLIKLRVFVPKLTAIELPIAQIPAFHTKCHTSSL